MAVVLATPLHRLLLTRSVYKITHTPLVVSLFVLQGVVYVSIEGFCRSRKQENLRVISLYLQYIQFQYVHVVQHV